MSVQEVGRWVCEKCGETCVAAGPKDRRIRIGIVGGAPCPWECGLRSNRGFRHVNATYVTLYTLEAWQQRHFNPAGALRAVEGATA